MDNRAQVVTGKLSDPPTQEELVAILGAPPAMGTPVYVVETPNHERAYFVTSLGGNWSYMPMTKAV
jgi:hypothetical protein